MQVKNRHGNKENSTTELYNKWILDSDASDSICNKRSWFLSLYKLTIPHQIRLRTYTTVSTSYRGMVNISGVIIDALYVPEFRVSLLSVSELDKLGYKLYFNNGLWSLKSQEGFEHPFACLINGLYEVTDRGPTGTGDPQSAKASRNERAYYAGASLERVYKNWEWNSWHCRLGHVNDLALARSQELNLVPGVSHPNSKVDINGQDKCITCIRSKLQRHYSRKPVQRTSRPFELLNSDSCGPIPPSKADSRYFILFIDDYTRMTYVYFLQRKNAELCSNAFVEFLNYQSSHYPQFPVARFRSDNRRGESDNELFRRLLRERGISFEPSVPYSPHQNGVAERMIQTITTRARSILLDP